MVPKMVSKKGSMKVESKVYQKDIRKVEKWAAEKVFEKVVTKV